jgi:HEAT repeat protein
VEIGRLRETLTRACGTLDWDGALDAASRLVRLAPQVPQVARRGYGIQVRRAIPRPAIEALVDLAERDPACRPAAADVLRWIGLGAADVILDRLRQGELLGVRVFFYDVVGGMPDAFPMVAAMVRSHHAHEIRHGATLLGRLGLAEGVELLEPLLASRDDLVRAAVIHALGALHEGAAANALRRALHHPSPRTRAAAADAIANWRGGALAILLVTAMDTERDRDAWHAIVMALGRVGTSDACSALTTVALSRRSLLRRQGYSTGQRLAAVGALGASDSPLARTALHRLLREGEGVVRYAADRVLHSEAQRAG